ncbi:nicotinate (nicotinamide) nucleotide adenylyltransferase [Limnohabitans radicicola]|uniref:nicotinate (nicotinamide) nucleotide adenylyltransferase n=1 Tax=Limnohabitans radicicola TaxID=2771427 RepID=UPI002FD52C74
MNKPLRIGVFGGAFDPPHLAHVALVQSAIAQLQLDEVRVLPTGQAWHKAHGLSDPAHRLAMTRLAFEGVARVVVDGRELVRTGPSYTVDTLQELVLERPGGQLYLLIGDDQRRSLPSWHRIGDIARMAIICAADRDPDVGAWGDAHVTGTSAQASFSLPTQTLHMPLMPLSATDIRQRIAHHQPIEGLVPAAVERYIHEHHLYRPIDD